LIASFAVKSSGGALRSVIYAFVFTHFFIAQNGIIHLPYPPFGVYNKFLIHP